MGSLLGGDKANPRYGAAVSRLSLPCLLWAVAALPAAAAEVACHAEGGVIVLSATVAGLPGDYILDTGTAQTTLHETRAQMEAVPEDGTVGEVRLGGVVTGPLPVAVADLDARTVFLPTPVAGVIGADALKGFVVDVSYAPCRVRIWRPGEAPRFRGETLALTWDAGRPAVTASVGDDVRRLSDRFVIATGANAAVRLADDLAAAPGAGQPEELYPGGVWLARLAEARLGHAVGRDLPAGLMKPDGAAAGVIGGPALAHFRLRFDFPAGRLVVQPAP